MYNCVIIDTVRTKTLAQAYLLVEFRTHAEDRPNNLIKSVGD